MLLKQMILLSVKQFQQQRSSSAIYHLLTGKRSIQTVQDAHLFGLDRFYGVLPHLSRQTFMERINKYQVSQLICKRDEKNFSSLTLTNIGQSYLTDMSTQIDYFNGLTFYKIDELFYEKVILLTQVLTNQYNGNQSYIPVVENEQVLQWMRRFYQRIKEDLETYLYRLYDELHQLLSHFPEEEAEIFVKRLTAYKHYGLSLQQLSNMYSYSLEHIQLLLKGIVHKMLQLIKNDLTSFKFLNLLLKELPSYNMLTKSAQATYELFKKSYTPKQIAAKRRLKMSTIYDHIVEICWYDQDFPIKTFVSKEQIEKVKEAVTKVKSLKLKLIKQYAPEELTYFQIRLALTRMKNIFSVGESSDDHR